MHFNNVTMKQCDNDVFNPSPPTIMHIDLNSCFTTIEQQANPRLRGKPVAVAAYTSPGGCILAASIEAKTYGVKTGMRVREGKILCPSLVVLSSDPDKYRFVNRRLVKLLSEYTADVEVRSIDEMVLSLQNSPFVTRAIAATKLCHGVILSQMEVIAKEIKHRIKQEIGEWLVVSIGISTNQYLAKIASGLHKPDGLDVITKANIEEILTGLQLEELCGIKAGYGGRLRNHGIATAIAMYRATRQELTHAFHSKVGYDWWLWLHGFDSPGNSWGKIEEPKTIGHSFALRIPYIPMDIKLCQILCQLVEKMGRRIRNHHLVAGGIHISCLFTDYTYWNHGEKLASSLFASCDLYTEAMRILAKSPQKPVRILAVSCFSLSSEDDEQLSLLASQDRKRALSRAIDTIAGRWGEFVIFPGRMLHMEQKIVDRIAFGGVKSLTESTFST